MIRGLLAAAMLADGQDVYVGPAQTQVHTVAVEQTLKDRAVEHPINLYIT